MIQIYIFADSHKHFTEAISEYKKRLWNTIELRELKPYKKWTQREIVRAETEIVISKLKKERGYKILLSPNGGNISTEKLSEMLESQKSHGKIIFIIGWANGCDYSLIREYIDFELSLGKMIFPHSLALTLLLEQIYRCSEIEKWSKYHK